MRIVRCPSCDGYGWFEDAPQDADCGWCGGVGYVYRDAAGVDALIPRADFEAAAPELERLELERLREMGYQGVAKKPWQQAVRRNTRLGRRPDADAADDADDAGGE